ncbi:hypothetical protein WN55_10232 [Dufourea novaeangliae]|uniref:Uncharacterized protein n=1 Tax=Dufourea novaeangliae TaxID=178035 RepID=A0A154P3C0_DUFNO|nr:hypothetical protein WN55_10232 [Dufourea novaeangliae]
MNGFKTLVLQDLPHVLPPKGLHISTKLPSAHLHTATTARRFWNFFEFAGKEDGSRGMKQQDLSRQFVGSEPMVNETEEVSRIGSASIPSVAGVASMTPKLHSCQFDLTGARRVSYLNIPKPINEDSLMSLLDGNPVPRTLKWKLKGYKTLRYQPSDDVGFVPGSKHQLDVDFLTSSYMNDLPETSTFSNALGTLEPAEGSIRTSSKLLEKVSENSAASPVKTIETEKLEDGETMEMKYMFDSDTVKVKSIIVKGVKEENAVEDPMISKGQTVENIGKSWPSSGQKCLVGQKLLAVPKTENIKYLPISKPELPAVPLMHHLQPSVQYSSRPPDDFRESRLPQQEEITAGRKPPMKRYEQDPDYSSDICREATEQGTHSMDRQAVAKESSWRTEDLDNYPEDFGQQELETKPTEVTRYGRHSSMSEKKSTDYQDHSVKNTGQRTSLDADPSEYFAPKSWKSRFQKGSDQKSLHEVYESIGIDFGETAPLKISSPAEGQQGTTTSPCAATHAKLQRNGGNAPKRATGSSGPLDGSSMSGNNGGSRKPPAAAYPPFTTRRSSSSNTSLLTRPVRVTTNPARRSTVNPKTSTSSISTGARRLRQKCRDEDPDDTCQGKTICTKPRDVCKKRPSCGQTVKKKCKRYCCPALQTSPECDWDRFQCGKQQKKDDCCERRPQRKSMKKKVDSTCLPPDESEGGREICTNPRRNVRSCERRDRCQRRDSCQERPTCKRERRSCERRDRSCKRQERRECDDRSQGREICTKPRRRKSCDRRQDSCDRDCSRKSEKCNRRNYTQLAYSGRPRNCPSRRRFASVPAIGFSLAVRTATGAANGQTKESTKTLHGVGGSSLSIGRFYGKKGPSSPCGGTKSTDKCKKPAAKCLDKKPSVSSCKTETKCKEPEKKCQPTCGKSEKKPSTCKTGQSKIEDMCAKKRAEVCKGKQASSKEETAKERSERERKEMQECKKDISGRRDKDKSKEKKMAATGLERVISPCKQGNAGKSGCGKTSCVAAISPITGFPGGGELFIKSDNNSLFSSLPDRFYSTGKLSQHENEMDEQSMNQWNDYTNFYSYDNVPPVSTGFGQYTDEASNQSSFGGNWFLSWFQN